ncbi:hypothetical protein O988_08106 [Pseudogymnoascus sp. VKM F-3808]|nr:hypothetical protein O988_08106 [Pseudogymnoascus sp. VKM F-3808]
MATMELHKLRHRRAHSGSSSVEFDNGPQKTHPSTGTDLSATSPAEYSKISALSDSEIPPGESTDPHYKTYSVHNLDMQNITLHANQDGPALYTVINSTFTAGAHSVVLHKGPRTTPPIGAANIATFKGTNQFGVCTGASTALEGMEGMELYNSGPEDIYQANDPASAVGKFQTCLSERGSSGSWWCVVASAEAGRPV